MLIYFDIFSKDEMASDTYPIKVVDDVILEFEGKYEVWKEGEVKLAGANASAEEPAEDEGNDESVKRGINLILSHQLRDMPVYTDPKQFKEYLKEYMKKLAAHLKKEGMSDDDLTEWKKKMQTYFGALMKKDRFKNLLFYVGPGDNASEGQLAILEYRDVDDVEKPFILLVKAGLIEEKV